MGLIITYPSQLGMCHRRGINAGFKHTSCRRPLRRLCDMTSGVDIGTKNKLPIESEEITRVVYKEIKED